MSSIYKDSKDPDDIDDFSVNWVRRLAAGETISAVACSIVSGDAVVSASSHANGISTARLTGGTAGTQVQVRHRITTSTGRQLDETTTIRIEVG